MPETIKTQEFLGSILSLAASSGMTEQQLSEDDKFSVKSRLKLFVSEYVHRLVIKPCQNNGVNFDLSNSDFSDLELDSKPATTTTADFLQRILSVASGFSEQNAPAVKDQVNLAVSQYIRHLLESVVTR